MEVRTARSRRPSAPVSPDRRCHRLPGSRSIRCGSSSRTSAVSRARHPRRASALERGLVCELTAIRRPVRRSSSVALAAQPATRLTAAAEPWVRTCPHRDKPRRRRSARRFSIPVTRHYPPAVAVAARDRSSSSHGRKTVERFAASAATKTRSRCRWWMRPAASSARQAEARRGAGRKPLADAGRLRDAARRRGIDRTWSRTSPR